MAISADEIEFTLRLRDQMSSALKQAAAQLESLNTNFQGTSRQAEKAGEATRSMVKEIALGTIAAHAIEKAAAEAFEALRRMGSAFFELGARGSDISSVSDTLKKFTGSAEAADDVLNRLRRGTLNTITDFELMKTSTKLLGAGVKLTAEEFGSLGEAAVTLKNRGLGDTKQMLDLVSDAMVTGRTRTLAMKLGVVDTDDAVRKHAASLGLYENQLSQAQRADAMRIAILAMVRKATADAGVATQDFGDILTAGGVAIDNFWNNLGRAIADSPKVMGAMRAMQTAISDAFGPDSQNLIETLMSWIDKFADAVARYGPKVVAWVQDIYNGAIHYGGIIIDWLIDIRDSVIKIYDKVMETWDALPEWLKEVAKYSAIAALGAQGAAMAVSGMATMYLESASMIATLVSGMVSLGEVIVANGGLLKMIFVHPLFLAIGVVAALVVAIRELTGSWDFIVKPAKAAWEIFKDVFGILSDIIGIIGNVIGWAGRLAGGLLSLIGLLTDTTGGWKKLYETYTGGEKQNETSWIDTVIEKLRWWRDLLADIHGYTSAVRFGPEGRGGLPNVSGPGGPLFSRPSGAGPAPALPGGGMPGSGLPPARTPGRDMVGEAVTRMMEEAANSIINAKAALEYYKRDAFTTTKEAESLYGAMQAVVDKFGYGSLESKLGRDAKAIYDYFDGTIGTIHGYSERLRGMAMQQFKPGSLPRQVDVKSIFSENPTTNPWFAGGAQGIRPFMSRNFANLPIGAGPGGLFSRERNPFLWTPGIGSAGGANQADLLRKRGIFGQNLKLPGAPGKRWTESLLGMTIGDFGTGMGSTIMGALQGGGNVGASLGGFFGQSMGGSAAKSLGKTAFGATGLGSMIGGFLPGLGALAGPLLGKAFSAIGNMFGLGTKGRDTVREFEGQFGGGDQLRDTLSQIGRSDLSDRLYRQVGRNDEKGAKAAIEAVTKAIKESQDALSRYGLTFDDLKSPVDRSAAALKRLGDDLALFGQMGNQNIEGVAQKLSGPLNDALRTAIETGSKLPESMIPYLQALTAGGGLANDLAMKLLGLPTPDVVPWQAMQDAAEEFGISLDNLGPRFQQSKLIESAEDLAAKWHLLVDNGADVNAVMVGMKDRVQGVLDNASKFGLEIPIAMKPMLEAMAKAGLLTDSAGLELKDLSTFKFSEDLTTKLDDLVEALDRLIQRLGSIPSPVITPVVNPPVFAPGSQDPRAGSGPSDDEPGHAFFGVVPRRPGGTNWRVGEGAEDEWVVPDSRMREIAAGGGDESMTVVELRRIRSMMERQQATLALAVRDAMLLSR